MNDLRPPASLIDARASYDRGYRDGHTDKLLAYASVIARTWPDYWYRVGYVVGQREGRSL